MKNTFIYKVKSISHTTKPLIVFYPTIHTSPSLKIDLITLISSILDCSIYSTGGYFFYLLKTSALMATLTLLKRVFEYIKNSYKLSLNF